MTALWLCSHRGWGSHRETRAPDAVLKADRQLPPLHSGPWWGRGGPDLQHAGQTLGEQCGPERDTQGTRAVYSIPVIPLDRGQAPGSECPSTHSPPGAKTLP